jgi:hypothetical protein
MCLESMVSRHRKEQKKSTYISCMLANVKNPHLYAEMSPYDSKIASVKAAYETLNSFCALQLYVASRLDVATVKICRYIADSRI